MICGYNVQKKLMVKFKGVFLSLSASTLFGVLYYYSSLLKPLGGEDIFAWRMMLTVPFMVAFTCAIGEHDRVRDIVRRVKEKPALALVLVASSGLLGIQMWLFMWAPLHNRALEVSLGYFMLPLSIVLADRLIYKAKLTGWQTLAFISALIGVIHEVIRIGGFSWPALVVALGFPGYFILRRTFKFDHLGGLWFDLVLMLPAATWLALNGQLNLQLLSNMPAFWWLIPLLGLISAGALMAYILASRFLQFAVFGLLGYVEPILLVVVALLLGETLSASEWFTYAPIWLAVGFMAMEGILYLRKNAVTPT